MVYTKLESVTIDWVRVAQILIGSFFLGAAVFKLYNYFILADQTLSDHFQFWIDNQWPPKWFEWLMINIGQPNHKLIAAGVIVAQAIPGLMFVLNYRVRAAAVVLLLMQCMVFLGVYHHTNFNEFVGLSVWVSLFYVVKPEKHENISHGTWQFLTLGLLVIILLQSFNRFSFYGDHLLRSVDYQRAHLAGDVSSIYMPLKQFVLRITEYRFMQYVWVGMWYLRFALALLILTKLRLPAQSLNLVLWIFTAVLWMNATTSQGVLWVLTIFVYVTMEHFLQEKHPEFKNSSILGFVWKELKRFASASW